MALYMQAYNKSSKRIWEIERRSELELEIKFVSSPKLDTICCPQEVHVQFDGCHKSNSIAMLTCEVTKKTNIPHILRFYGLSFILSII